MQRYIAGIAVARPGEFCRLSALISAEPRERAPLQGESTVSARVGKSFLNQSTEPYVITVTR